MPSPVESRRSESSQSPHVSSPSPSPDVKDSSPSPARSGLESDSSPSPRTRVPISVEWIFRSGLEDMCSNIVSMNVVSIKVKIMNDSIRKSISQMKIVYVPGLYDRLKSQSVSCTD